MHEENYVFIASFEKKNWWYRAKRHLFSLILKRMNKRFEQSLDLGCGVGSNFSVLSKWSKNVIGVDYSVQAIEYCKSNPYHKLRQMDATKLKFKDNSFDLILCSDVLEHIDDAKAIEEITRILKPEGIFIFSVPAHNYLWGPTDVISKHRKRYEMHDLKKLLSKDYNIKKLSYWNTLALLPDLIIMKLLKLFGKHREEKNALSFIPSILNNILYSVLYLENNWFIRFNNPEGVSIVGIAQKNVNKN